MLRPGTNVCQCATCGEYFLSVSGFDRHRVGDPANRRCLSNAEMRQRGMAKDAQNRWTRSPKPECVFTEIVDSAHRVPVLLRDLRPSFGA